MRENKDIAKALAAKADELIKNNVIDEIDQDRRSNFLLLISAVKKIGDLSSNVLIGRDILENASQDLRSYDIPSSQTFSVTHQPVSDDKARKSILGFMDKVALSGLVDTSPINTLGKQTYR